MNFNKNYKKNDKTDFGFTYNVKKNTSQSITQFEKNLFQARKTNPTSQFKQPITSIGIIGFVYNELINDYQFLMIRRKDTLGYVDFMRGKYQLFNKQYIMNILNETTIQEQEKLKQDFDYNWKELWGDLILKQRYLNEESISKDKFNSLKEGVHSVKVEYNLDSCLKEINTNWTEPEWGFPKGRREHKEKEITTAVREFCEETGLKSEDIKIINNVQPYEEIFNGSNFKSYKHKYYVAKINSPLNLENYQKSEVSALEWKTYNDAINCLRDYDYEKKEILEHLYQVLHNYDIQ